MKYLCVAILSVIAAGCVKPKPANLSVGMDVARPSAGVTTLSLRIKNRETIATTPLLVNVTVQTNEGGNWSAPKSVLHPAAFVLNKNEEQILHATIKTVREGLKAKVTIKEQENGQTVVDQEFER